jgi:hypothetical protein
MRGGFFRIMFFSSMQNLITPIFSPGVYGREWDRVKQEFTGEGGRPLLSALSQSVK